MKKRSTIVLVISYQQVRKCHFSSKSSIISFECIKDFSLRSARHRRQGQLSIDRVNTPKVILINERDPEKSAERIVEWLFQHYPGLKIDQLAVVKQNNRFYQRATFKTANGQQKIVLFDITAALQNNMRTSAQVFQAGTMVRLWPRTGSTPTRRQILI